MVKKLLQSVLCVMMSGLMVMPALAAEGSEATGARNGTETSLAAPKLSMTLDFEEAALGVYTAAGGEDTQGSVVSDGTVTVTAKLGAFAPYTGRKVLIALYQNYGGEDSGMLDAAICEYATSDDDFTAELDAGEETSALSVKVYLWEDMSTLKPMGEALTVDVN